MPHSGAFLRVRAVRAGYSRKLVSAQLSAFSRNARIVGVCAAMAGRAQSFQLSALSYQPEFAGAVGIATDEVRDRFTRSKLSALSFQLSANGTEVVRRTHVPPERIGADQVNDDAGVEHVQWRRLQLRRSRAASISSSVSSPGQRPMMAFTPVCRVWRWRAVEASPAETKGGGSARAPADCACRRAERRRHGLTLDQCETLGSIRRNKLQVP